MKEGEMIALIDGTGKKYSARLSKVNTKACLADIVSVVHEDPLRNYRLHLAIAPTKQIDRIEWMVEKCVEIGIDEITFLRSKNSERTVIKTDRINKIVLSAVKQSIQARIPKVNELTTLDVLLKNDDHTTLKLIAHCKEAEKKELSQFELKDKNILILIGPEGDFTDAELKEALSCGFQAVSLGKTRLRTETAGLLACTAVSILSSV